jgi:hypothetical protein
MFSKLPRVALVHARDQGAELLAVADLLKLEEPALGAVPEQHAHFIGGAEGVQGADGAVAGGLVAAGEFHAVHHEHHRAGRQDFFAVEFHADRQSGVERGVAVAAGSKGLVAADADEADPRKSRTALSS